MRKDVSADDPMQILHSYREVLSRNNLGELQKLLPPSVSTFDIWLMDSKFRNFPPLLFHPPLQNRLAKKPSWAARHDLNKNWANPAKCGDLLLTSQLIPAPLGGSWLRRWSVFWNIVNATTQQNKNEPVFHQLPERPNVSFIFEKFIHSTIRVTKICTRNHRSIFLSIEKSSTAPPPSRDSQKYHPTFEGGFFRG